ncbi:hypothetical protein HFU84_13100 [Acidithiobacillus sp. CV18-2]|nr:hypothetical protein [Acidithiobacillus sp. CV18-3]MBU2758458.1 hypothetical protein [Acidithiobacillus sp. BN09-2]MBU2778414.1 hypothetical protein [Acidithiobacillus sp. CV18-2]MBU2798242.1 hypothetical protein [Acidithiobacillus sp. VAN18-4]
MPDKQSDTKRDGRGLFLPGTRAGPGRPKGRGNLFPMTLKDDILEAYQQLGGIAWLVQLGREEPKVFAALLARLLPAEKADADDGKTVIVIRGGPDACDDD